MKEMTGIALTEEVVAVGGGVTMGELCACEAVRAEAPAVAPPLGRALHSP